MESDDERVRRFERMFATCEPAVRAYARRRAPMALADDVVSETFLVAWRRLDRLDEDALPWLLGVTRRLLANQFRASRRRDALVARLRGADIGPQRFEAPEDMSPRLAGALRELPAREREALLLLAWEELDITRAARAAGCSSATFRVRLHRARRRVAAAMKAEPELGYEAMIREEAG